MLCMYLFRLLQSLALSALDRIVQILEKTWWYYHIFLLVVKFGKVLVHTFSYYVLWRRIPLRNTVYKPSDVTVIVSTVGDFGIEFQMCIRSILENKPARILVVTVGDMANAISACEKLCPYTIEVMAIDEPDKRRQFLKAVGSVTTQIIVTADDHVKWPKTYLQSTLMPFDDEKTGLVGTVKRVIRDRGNSVLESALNYEAVIYLERHNFECTASYNIDGGIFVISGRTALMRTEIVRTNEFHHEYLNGEFTP